MNLEDWLNEVDILFGVDKDKEPELSPYLYTLGRFPYGWVFNVVSSWSKWSDAGYDHQFGVYLNPVDAVRDFLHYVQEHEIDVQELMSPSTWMAIGRLLQCFKRRKVIYGCLYLFVR